MAAWHAAPPGQVIPLVPAAGGQETPARGQKPGMVPGRERRRHICGGVNEAIPGTSPDDLSR